VSTTASKLPGVKVLLLLLLLLLLLGTSCELWC
jgi:hypothetical protein